jgi:DNA mismatch endonuclease (patch repair protein)
MTSHEEPLPASESVRQRMQRQARRDTSIEVELRRRLWERGLRYRVDRSVVVPRRRHDIVFIGPRLVVDVRGCFWHGCPEHGTVPANNRAWWVEKLEGNRRRDDDTERRLAENGWLVVVVWEHDDLDAAADRIEELVLGRTRRGPTA